MDGVDLRRVVRGHGVKGRRHEAKFKSLKNLTVLTDAGSNKTFPNLGHTPYVCSMCGGATLTKGGHFLNMKPIGKIIISNIQVAWMNI